MTAPNATKAKRDAPPTLDLADAATMRAEDVLRALESSSDGLSSTEAQARLERVGPNALRSHGEGAIAVLVGQLWSPFLLLLLATAVASAFFGERTALRAPSRRCTRSSGTRSSRCGKGPLPSST
jgi:Mg2+-importing ATPase